MRPVPIIAGILMFAIITMAFGWLYSWWFGMNPDQHAMLLMIFAAATGLAIGLFLLGQALSIDAHAYYIIVAGAVFLGADILLWLQFGIMPGPKFFQDGFMPASILGVFLGVLYRVIAVHVPPMPRDPS